MDARNNNIQDINNNLYNTEKFLNDASHGAIYVNLGENISQKLKETLIETFKDFKQHFVWENEPIVDDLPSNIQMCRQFSSRLALSHKNTALCISNDDTVTIKQALHYGIPILIIVPFQSNKLNNIIKTTVLENISTIRLDEINMENLTEKLNRMLNNGDLKNQAKEIASLLHHNSALNNIVLDDECSIYSNEKSQQLSTNHLHLDALGALFFLIFIIVKLSLKFCRFYNNFEWGGARAAPKKTK